ncbi:MAG: molybdopterin biosynthesis protein [Desulfurococcaceae archaeon]
MRKIFHRLASLDEAIRAVINAIDLKPLGVEDIDVFDAINRVLAVDVYAPIDHPPFDRSEVDGYAVRSEDTAWADELSPMRLRLKGKVRIGEFPSIELNSGEAIEIATGAMIPRGCDAVVMEEYVEKKNGEILVYRSIAPGENIATAGSDISMGDLVIPAGTILREEHIGLLAGLGFSKITVYKRPRIAVYSIGNELAKRGEVLRPGMVYDVNGALITSYLRSMGAVAVFKGVLPDDYGVIRDEIYRSIVEYDMVVTSGGTSAGEEDIIYKIFEEIGNVVVHGLRTKPGKPTIIAVSSGKLLIGLPGFPLSCYMVLVRVVRPIIARILGIREEVDTIHVKLSLSIRKHIGKTWLIPVILVESRGELVAYPVSMSSGSISPLIYSDGFIELDENVDIVEENTLVRFHPFRNYISLNRLSIIGSNDPLLFEILKETGLIHRARVLNVGSTAGWNSVVRGEADIAPTHLLDPETRRYNVPFLDKYGLRGKAVIIRGYDRLIGLVVARGNPKKIKSLEDLLRGDIRMVNRNRGSGARVFLDMKLKEIFEKKGISFDNVERIINGYTYEVKTHTAVAVAVKQGRADVGIAVGYVADMYGLDFIPLTWEEYDFLIPMDRLEKGLVAMFINHLRDKDLLARLIRYPGYYRIPSDIGLERPFD